MRYISIVFCAVSLILFSEQTQARIIHVPADSSTIEAGIRGAVDGDTVLVAQGTYYEHIRFYGKAILLKSESGAENTVISKLYDGVAIVIFEFGEDTFSVIDGFTIRNAVGADGIKCINASSPKIINNIIRNNSKSGDGGGILCSEVNGAQIINNEIIGNSSTGKGGGIYTNGRALIEGNHFSDNHSDDGGGAICLMGGIGIIITKNLVVHNSTSDDWGGVIYQQSAIGTQILNNTISDNTKTSGGGGAGITLQSGSNITIKNNCVTYNSKYGIYVASATAIVLEYNDFFGNFSGDYYGCVPGYGSISADPIFCDTASDNYYLSGSSPCVGAGEGGVDIGALGIGCGNLPYDVQLTAGSNKSGRAQTAVQVEFYVSNMGFLSDTYDLNITDSLAWTINPTHYTIPLDSAQTDTVTFTVSIPYVPIGTVDKLRLTAISQTDSSVSDTAYLTVTCNAIVEGVEVTAGSNQSGYADSIVSVAFLVQNVGVVRDSYSVDIWDIQGWNIVPLHYDLTLDSAQAESVSSVINIPYVQLGTSDLLTLRAVSKTNSLARDSASLTVTCDAYIEGWSITSGGDISAPAHSQVTAVFYVQNTGLAPDSCYADVSDSLGWVIQPQSYRLSLDPGQYDSVTFDVQIPSVSVGTKNKIILTGGSLTNPYVLDSANLLVTCNSYNIAIRRIFDVGNDQGKQVRLEWTSFPGSDPLVTEFSVFRRRDSLLTTSFAPLVSDLGIPAYPPGEWDWLVTIPAFGETLYSMVAPTLRDSTIAEGMYWSVFFIRAGTNNPVVYFDSPIDSGYSLDNLFPSPPTGLLAFHAPATTKLKWSATSAPDFDYYTIYRDTVSGFTPNLANRLVFTIDTIFVDSTAQLGRPFYYLASATDFSGNESNPSNEAMGIRYITGDANADGVINSADVSYLINYLFVNGPAPQPWQAGDANCDSAINSADVAYLINYLFIGGPPPVC